MTQNAGQYVPNRGQNSWRRCRHEARGPGPGDLGPPGCPVRLVGPGEPARARGAACRIWPNRASSSRADPLLPNPSAIHRICAIGRKKAWPPSSTVTKKAVAVGIGVQFHRRDSSFYCSYTAQGTASERARQRAFAALGATASLFFWAKSPPRGIRKPELPEARVRRIGMDS